MSYRSKKTTVNKVALGVCNCSMFCCTLLYALSSIAIILMGKRELVALLALSSWCLVIVEGLFLAVPWGCLQFVIVVFPDDTHLLFLEYFYGHFINVNNVTNGNNDFHFNIQNADVNYNFELTKSFYEDDILHAIKSLKNKQ